MQAAIKAVAPHAIYIYRRAHRLNIVLGDYISNLRRMASFFSILQELYCFIANSNIHYQLFVNAQKAAGITVPQLEKSSTTRLVYWYIYRWTKYWIDTTVLWLFHQLPKHSSGVGSATPTRNQSSDIWIYIYTPSSGTFFLPQYLEQLQVVDL